MISNEILAGFVTEVGDGGYVQNKAALFGAFAMKDARCVVRAISNQTELNSEHSQTQVVCSKRKMQRHHREFVNMTHHYLP